MPEALRRFDVLKTKRAIGTHEIEIVNDPG